MGAITPVTHSLPTLAGNAINMLASRGNTVVYNAHPSPWGPDIAAEGVRRVQQGHLREAIRTRNSARLRSSTRPRSNRPTDLFKHRGCPPPGRRLGPGRRAGRPGEQASGRSSRGRASPPVVVDATACLENGRPSRSSRGRLRQQPALHRRERGPRRRPRSSTRSWRSMAADHGRPVSGYRPGRRPDARPPSRRGTDQRPVP